MTKPKKQGAGRPVTALLLVAALAGYILKLTGVLPHFTLLFDGFWTLFIIVPSIICIASGKKRSTGLIWLLIGAALLVICTDSLGDARAAIAPLLLVAAALLICLKRGAFANRRVYLRESGTHILLPVYRFFLSRKMLCPQETNFTGAFVNSLFSECGVSFSGQSFSGGTVLDITAVCSQVEITLPIGTEVQIVHRRSKKKIKDGHITVTRGSAPTDDGAPEVFINPHTLLGKIEVSFS